MRRTVDLAERINIFTASPAALSDEDLRSTTCWIRHLLENAARGGYLPQETPALRSRLCALVREGKRRGETCE